MEASELKPCPWCGPITEEIVDVTRILGLWRLIHRCRSIGPVSIESSDRARVVSIWNTRAQPALAEAEKAVVEAAIEHAAEHATIWAVFSPGKLCQCGICSTVRAMLAAREKEPKRE